LTGATTVGRTDGTIDVYVGGSSLVSGAVARKLVAVGAQQLESQAADKVRLRWESTTGPVASVTGGRLAADLDVMGKIIPDLAAQLDAVAATLATKVNTVHNTAYGLDSVLVTDTAGDFFVPSFGVVINARSISVAITNPRDVGAADTPATRDGTKAATMSAIAKASDGPDGKYRALIVGLGVAAQTAGRRADIQTKVAADMDVLRSADAGVNLDEEMTNMISFQRAYEAASRVLTSVDEMLDVLINRTGLVGR
jgi:flagellar hook-associated protein 1 FlgK